MSNSSKGSSKTARAARVAWTMANTPPETEEEKAEREAALAKLQEQEAQRRGGGGGDAGDTEAKPRHKQPRPFAGPKADPHAIHHRHGGRTAKINL